MPTSDQKQQCQWLVQDYQGRFLVAKSTKSSCHNEIALQTFLLLLSHFNNLLAELNFFDLEKNEMI